MGVKRFIQQYNFLFDPKYALLILLAQNKNFQTARVCLPSAFQDKEYSPSGDDRKTKVIPGFFFFFFFFTSSQVPTKSWKNCFEENRIYHLGIMNLRQIVLDKID